MWERKEGRGILVSGKEEGKGMIVEKEEGEGMIVRREGGKRNDCRK